jgi:hypothetical protein
MRLARPESSEGRRASQGRMSYLADPIIQFLRQARALAISGADLVGLGEADGQRLQVLQLVKLGDGVGVNMSAIQAEVLQRLQALHRFQAGVGELEVAVIVTVVWGPRRLARRGPRAGISQLSEDSR